MKNSKEVTKETIVEFKNVFFSYQNDNHYNLNDVSFTIKENEYLCIIGHNGSGKSTISKVLSGLLKPASGDIFIKGEKVTHNNIMRLKKNIGIIFQNPDNQFVGITAEDDIAFGLENYMIRNEKMQEIIETSAKIIDITPLLKKEVHALSGGQKQKVAITSILSLLPSVIIFDESTSMLDPRAKNELKALMYFLKTELNKTIISITHDMEELKQADRIIFMSKGQIIANDEPLKLLFDYQFMKEHALDVPYDLQVVHALKDLGVNIEKTLDHQVLIKKVAQ